LQEATDSFVVALLRRGASGTATERRGYSSDPLSEISTD